MKNKIFTGVFALLLFGLTALTLLLPKKTFSETEKRDLAAFPSLSADTVLDGSFQSGLSDYLGDHFVCRDLFISADSAFSLALGKTGQNGVYLTKNGLMDSFYASDAKRFDENVEALTAFSGLLSERNVAFRALIVPTATQVYADRLPTGATDLDSAPFFERLKTVPGYVDVRDALSAHRDQKLYYQTDHHWTAIGAYLAYSAYKESIGETPETLDSFRLQTVADEFYGTLYSRFGLFLPVFSDTVEAPSPDVLGPLTVVNSKNETTHSIYAPERLSGKDKYLYFLGGNDSVLHITTEAENGRRLMLIKDSYANSFLPYLIRDYEAITVVDLRYLNSDLVLNMIEKEGITDVLVLYNLKSFASDSGVPLLTLR